MKKQYFILGLCTFAFFCASFATAQDEETSELSRSWHLPKLPASNSQAKETTEENNQSVTEKAKEIGTQITDAVGTSKNKISELVAEQVDERLDSSKEKIRTMVTEQVESIASGFTSALQSGTQAAWNDIGTHCSSLAQAYVISHSEGELAEETAESWMPVVKEHPIALVTYAVVFGESGAVWVLKHPTSGCVLLWPFIHPFLTLLLLYILQKFIIFLLRKKCHALLFTPECKCKRCSHYQEAVKK